MLSSAAGSATRFRAKRMAMKTTSQTPRLRCAFLVFVSLLLTTRAIASAADFYPSDTHAKVVARLPLSGGGPTRMFLRQEGKTRYLYVQRGSQLPVTVIDVTKPRRPKLIHRVPLETLTVMGSGLVVTETLDHSATAGPSGIENGDGDHRGDAVPETVHVLDINDPAHSSTVQIPNSGTSILEDPAHNLIYMVNGGGVWILSHQHAGR
jgi:hypothetical protein